jgi:hypothetical protein
MAPVSDIGTGLGGGTSGGGGGRVSGSIYARLVALAGMAVVLGILYYWWHSGSSAGGSAAPGTGATGAAGAGGTAGAGGSAAVGPGAGTSARPATAAARPPTAVRRLPKEDRAKLAMVIEAARKARMYAGVAGTPTSTDLDKEYIRAAIKNIQPLLRECYENALLVHPELAGKIEVEFMITGEPDVGGMVESSSVMETSTIADPDLRECIQETMYALELPAPPAGGSVMVHYPFLFSSDGPPGSAAPGSGAPGSAAPGSAAPEKPGAPGASAAPKAP